MDPQKIQNAANDGLKRYIGDLVMTLQLMAAENEALRTELAALKDHRETSE